MGNIDASDVYQLEYNSFEFIPRERWIKIHQQQPDDLIRFNRQSYAGSGFDQLRSQLLLFGGQAVGENWNNTIYSFDLNSLQWNRAYFSDSVNTYTINDKGLPVAGVNGNHPWVMQSHAAVTYDKLHGKLVVASKPKEMSDKKQGQSLTAKWKLIKKNPTWLYSSTTNQWEAYEGESESFSPYAIAYDSDRHVVTGFRPNGIYDWNGFVKGWDKIGDKAYPEWHTNAVYDSINHVFILYGGNELKNAIHIYEVGEKTTEKMPTNGVRPPAGQSVPLAFHKKLGKMVAVIDSKENTQTWLYDYAKDQWEQISGTDFPYAIGMNYTMEYDVRNNIIVLVSSPENEETAVWVLRL